jgi:hypothetical protein
MRFRWALAWGSVVWIGAIPRVVWGQSAPVTSDAGAVVPSDAGVTMDAGGGMDAGAVPEVDPREDDSPSEIADPGEGAIGADGGARADGTEGGAPVAQTRVVRVDTAPIGVDPTAAAFVDRVMDEHLTAVGMTVVPREVMYEAARGLGLGFPVEPEGLARLNEALGASAAVTCELRARGGYYFAVVRVRRADEGRERSLGVVATQWTLGDRVREAITALLRPDARSSVTVTSTGLAAEAPTPAPLFAQTITIPPRAEVRLHPRPFELSLQVHGAFNPSRDPYTNVLVGGRFAWFPMDRLGVSGALSYANLRGRVGRVSNVLPMVGIESGVDLVPALELFVPLRAEVGYLPFNGLVLRLTAGLTFTLVRQLRLELDIVQPTIWVVNDSASVTLDVGAHLTWTFGGDTAAPPRRRRRPRNGTRRTPAPTATGAGAATTP